MKQSKKELKEIADLTEACTQLKPGDFHMVSIKDFQNASNVTVPPPNMKAIAAKIVGDSPLVVNCWSTKAITQMAEDLTKDKSQSKKGKTLLAHDFRAEYEASKHVATADWEAISALSVAHCMISACRLVNYKMTIGKIAFKIIPDGWDRQDASPLIRLIKSKGHMDIRPVTLKSGGKTLRSRVMYDEGWEAIVRIVYDADMFQQADIANLLMRGGSQCGIHEGRPSSPDSIGMGWGTFKVA